MVQWFYIGAVSFLHFHPLRRVSSLMIVVVTMIALLMKTPDDYKGIAPKAIVRTDFKNQPQTYLTESNILCVLIIEKIL